MSRIAIFLVVLLATCARLAIADTSYSRNVELPPLQVSFEDLQAMLDKVASLVMTANKRSSSWQEELQLRKGEQLVALSGHRLQPGGVKIPPSIDSFEYTGRVPYTGHDREETPIIRVAIGFYDYKRSVSVEGRSREAVDAVISALRDDLSKLSSPIQDSGLKPFLTSGLRLPPLATSRTLELPPLRVSFEDLQAMLDKVSSLVNAANKGSSNWEEELQLGKGEQRIKMSGHRLEPEGVKVPRSIDSFEYTGRASYTGRGGDETPITQVTISFHDYNRSVSVEGRSPEQVEAMISALRDDLSKLSIPIGNFGRAFLTWPGLLIGPILFLGWGLFVIWVIWLQTRRRILVVPAAICAMLLIRLLVLPLDEIFAGFSAVHGEASLSVRYGPEITIWGSVFSFLGLVVPTAIALLQGGRASN